MDGKMFELAEALKDRCKEIPTCTLCPLHKTICLSDGIVEEFPSDWGLKKAKQKLEDYQPKYHPNGQHCGLIID